MRTQDPRWTQDPRRTQDPMRTQDLMRIQDPRRAQDPMRTQENSEFFHDPLKTQELDFLIMCLLWWNLQLKADLFIIVTVECR